MAVGMEVGVGPGHIVLDGDQFPSAKKGKRPHIFGPSLLWPNGWMHQDATWYGGRPQTRRLCVRWGPNPYPKRSGAPHFSAHVYCGQTAGWMKTLLGTEADLVPGHTVLDLDGVPAPANVAQQPPLFGPPMSVVATVACLSYC